MVVKFEIIATFTVGYTRQNISLKTCTYGTTLAKKTYTLPLYIRQLPFALLSITMIVFQGVVLVSKKLAAIPDIQVFVQVILV